METLVVVGVSLGLAAIDLMLWIVLKSRASLFSELSRATRLIGFSAAFILAFVGFVIPLAGLGAIGIPLSIVSAIFCGELMLVALLLESYGSRFWGGVTDRSLARVRERAEVPPSWIERAATRIRGRSRSNGR
jgi:hypothetical protein